MAEWTRAAKVGVFAITAVAAGYGLWRFVNPASGTDGGYTVHAYLKDATGLASYSRVLVAGIPIGSIRSIRLEKGQARVDIKVKPDIALYKDADLAKRSSSLLGEFIIVIAPGHEQQPKLKDGDEITNVHEPISTDKIMNDLGHIANRVKDVSDSLAKSVGSKQGEQDITKMLHNLAEVTEQLNSTVKENREAIHRIVLNVDQISGQSGPQLNSILNNVNVITRDVRDLVADNKGDVKTSAGSLRKTLDRISVASKDLQSSMRHINSITGRMDRGEGTVGRLLKDETLIDEVQNTVEGVGDIVGGIQRTKMVVGLRNDYFFQANSIKSYVELRLQPREDKYYLIELVNDPRGLTTFQQTDVDTTNPTEPGHYREIRTTTTNALRFSFQFARRLGPFTGRFGIKESTGGVGFDTHLLDDRFEIQQDLFGFGEQAEPRWRLALSYEFVHSLWLLAGSDDMLSRDRRDYFIGLQLRFVDEDLKSILPFAPSSF